MKNNFNIEQFLDLSDYATDKRKARRKMIKISVKKYYIII